MTGRAASFGSIKMGLSKIAVPRFGKRDKHRRPLGYLLVTLAVVWVSRHLGTVSAPVPTTLYGNRDRIIRLFLHELLVNKFGAEIGALHQKCRSDQIEHHAQHQYTIG